MIAPDSISDSEPERIVELWMHESMRVFRDRLTEAKDRQWFDVLCKELVKKYSLLEDQYLEDIQFDSLFFGEYLARGEGDYKQVLDESKLSPCFSEACEDYNLTFAARMDLVFFDDAIRHVSRISRIPLPTPWKRIARWCWRERPKIPHSIGSVHR